MDDIDDITSARSRHRYQETTVIDIDSLGNSRSRDRHGYTDANRNYRNNDERSRDSRSSRVSNRSNDDRRLDVRELNNDEPRPAISPSRELLDTIRKIDQKAGGRHRLPMNSSQNIASVRIIPDSSNRSNRSDHSYRSDDHSSARSYRPKDYAETRKPDMNMSNSERAYMWRMKFQRLNARNPRIPIPDTNNPDSLEKLYAEAMRTDHYCSTSSTWLIYMGLGYGLFQGALHWMGVKLPPDFVFIQIQVMSHYPQLLKALGDPGGPSLGSSWPPWLKLAFVMCIHTVLFVLIYKMTGSVNSAKGVQNFICKTGFMGGKPQGEEVEADNAMANVGDMLGGLGGIFGGGNTGGGLGGMMQNLIGGMMGAMGRQDHVADIDLENPPEAVSERSTGVSSREFNSRRKTPFDE